MGANEPRTRLPVLYVTCLPADPLTWMDIYLTYALSVRRFVSLPDYVSYSTILLFTCLQIFPYSLSFIHSFVHLLFLLTHFTCFFFPPICLSSYSVTQSFHSLASIQSFNQSITHSPIDMFPNVLDITFNYSSVIRLFIHSNSLAPPDNTPVNRAQTQSFTELHVKEKQESQPGVSVSQVFQSASQSARQSESNTGLEGQTDMYCTCSHVPTINTSVHPSSVHPVS